MVAITTEFSKQPHSALLDDLRTTVGTAFLVGNALVQNLPDQPAEPVGDCPDRLAVSEPWDQTAVMGFEDAALGPHGGVSRLIQDVPHLPVPLG